MFSAKKIKYHDFSVFNGLSVWKVLSNLEPNNVINVLFNSLLSNAHLCLKWNIFPNSFFYSIQGEYKTRICIVFTQNYISLCRVFGWQILKFRANKFFDLKKVKKNICLYKLKSPCSLKWSPAGREYKNVFSILGLLLQYRTSISRI